MRATTDKLMLDLKGRDLSVFNQDLLTMLCCVLDKTGPIEITDAEMRKVDHSLLYADRNPVAESVTLTYGERVDG
jgi:hypothetical protein